MSNSNVDMIRTFLRRVVPAWKKIDGPQLCHLLAHVGRGAVAAQNVAGGTAEHLRDLLVADHAGHAARGGKREARPHGNTQSALAPQEEVAPQNTTEQKFAVKVWSVGYGRV